MGWWIELSEENGPVTISVGHVQHFTASTPEHTPWAQTVITFDDDEYIYVRETYEEVRRRIGLLR